MTTDQFARLRELFDAAVSLPEDARQVFVEQNTPGDEDLRAELVGLLKAHEHTTFLASPATPPPSVVAELLRTQTLKVGKYRVLRELGRGVSSTVYLAERLDDMSGKPVALKTISNAHGLVERFAQDRQLLTGLNHPNIARILDGGATEDGRAYCAMEYVDGVPIHTYCDRVNAASAERVRIVAQVCDAVAYLNDQAVKHRDLKPGNILVAADGCPKLIDFGVAMAPPPAIPATDVYKLGIILQNLLRNPQGDIALIVEKALNTGPLEYESVSMLAADLRRSLSGQPVSAKRATNIFTSRGKLAMTLAVAALLAGAIGTGIIGRKQVPEEIASDLQQRLITDRSKADRARRNIASAEYRLPAGQVAPADMAAALSRIDSYLSQAQAAFANNSYDETRTQIERAEAELERIFEKVGN